ncbi:MAG: TolC family protein, partial [Bacteroidota bacterium]|nr:TolC family protein [Bacteroidota bacterium]
MKKKLIAILIMRLSLVDIQAQDSAYISLNKLLKQVETNYPSIIQYQYSIQALQAKTEGAKSWMPPTFSAGIMRFPYKLMMLNEKNDPMNQAGLAFSVEQMIPNRSKLNAKMDYLNSLADIEKSKSDWTKNELRREAKILFYYRLINEKKQNILRENQELLNLLLTAAETNFSNNQSQLQNIYKAKARLAELKNMQLMLLGMIAESNIGLNILMLRDVNTSFEIDTLIEVHH